MSRCYVCNALPSDACMAGSLARFAECPRPSVDPRAATLPWVVVTDPGTDHEAEAALFDDRRTAEHWLRDYQAAGVPADLMKRRRDGGLTTEF